MNKLKILDLFSGIGGFSLGLERTGHFKTVAFCDNDKFSNLVLQKHWKGVKIYNNVKEITKERLEADGIESPDIITGGFPCQPFSVAGKQKGTSDDRHLWPEMFRIIKAFKPRFVIGENVRGIINIQDGVVFETVCTDLESEGYEVQPFIIPAAGVGAPHRRERVWIIAIREESMVNSNNIRFEQHNETEKEASRRRSSTTFESTGDVVNSEHNGSPTSTIEGSSAASSNDNEKGQIKTSEFEGTSGSRNDEIMENSRRTLRQGSSIREKNEDEVGKKNANQHQRSSSSSESNVADTNTRLGNGENQEIQTGRNTSNTSSEDVADNDGERQQKQWRTEPIQEEVSRQTKGIGSERQSWWSIEPDVGRVAHGVQGRVHRLKGLGNAIVPQIAETIGRALINAADKK